LRALTTILAVATPAGRGARAVVRLSGPDALAALDRLVVDDDGGEPSSGDVRARESRPGSPLCGVPGFAGRALRLAAGALRLDAWVAVFRAPRSYTREDVVEIHVPASEPVVGAVARALLAQDGVVWAGPGEFTLRAFLNGRIDLSRAEAVAQLIAATDEAEARAAGRALAGELARSIAAIVELLADALARVEASIDFADEDLPELASRELAAAIERVRGALRELRRSSSLRVVPAGGLRVAIAGLPNAGKSSLLNAILGREQAIVSALPGTTRDPVRGISNRDGMRVEWIDLAGTTHAAFDESRGAHGDSEAGLDITLDAGARRTLRDMFRLEVAAADRVLWVVDGASTQPDDRAAASFAPFASLDARRRILVINQIDRLDDAGAGWRREHPEASLVSARTAVGVRELERVVVASCGPRAHPPAAVALGGTPPRFLTSAHQEAAIESAAALLDRAAAAVASGLGSEFAAADLREALAALGGLTGKVTVDDILARIFSRFCVGK